MAIRAAVAVRRAVVAVAVAVMAASCGQGGSLPGRASGSAGSPGRAVSAGASQSPTSQSPMSRSPTGQSPNGQSPTNPSSAARSPGGSATAAAQGPGAATICVSGVLSRMTLEQQVGQLFMMGVASTGPTPAELDLIASEHLGGVILMGNSTLGVIGTRQVTDELQAQTGPQATAGVPLSIAVDQEGGEVQVLQGPGFSAMPTALWQGGTSPTQLRTQAEEWGRQLKAAGVTLDLAPVLDTVPADMTRVNQPIGVYEREYGDTPGAVAAPGGAFAAGLAEAGVQATAKHFPGLGRVVGNTDTTFGVTDNITTRNDPYLQPFAAAVSAGVPVVMVSLARYDQIDGLRAAFSPTVMQTMLRGDLAFHGVIMSDSMAATAVADLTPAERALQFLGAGGTVVLDTSPGDIPSMVDAVLAHAQQDPAFLAQVRAAAQLVLTQKLDAGLLACPATDTQTTHTPGAGSPTADSGGTGAPAADFSREVRPFPRTSG